MNITLTDDQKKEIVKTWDSGENKLKNLIEAAFPEKGYDGRSKHGIAVKKFLSEKKITAKPAHEYNKKEIFLTEEQKEKVKELIGTVSRVKMAKIIFGNKNLTNFSSEYRAINDYCKEIDPENLSNTPEDKEAKSYHAPRTIDQIIKRINKLIPNKFPPDKKLTEKEKLDLNCLIAFLNIPRFKMVMQGFSKEEHRELFESSFIRYCHDKSDIEEEEVDAYISLCLCVVNQQKSQLNINLLEDKLMDNVDGDAKISMALVEHINKSKSELDSCIKTQDRIRQELIKKRSRRLEDKNQGASIINLVGLWKEEKERHKMIGLAEMLKEETKEEADKFNTMEAFRAAIYGMSVEEFVKNQV